MIKRLIVTLIFIAFGFVSVSAAQAGTAGKVIAIDGLKVQITIEGEKPAWIKKGAIVKVADQADKVVVEAGKVSESADKNITITAREAGDLKVGDTVTLQKGKIMSGC